jgi:hypothetical protein
MNLSLALLKAGSFLVPCTCARILLESSEYNTSIFNTLSSPATVTSASHSFLRLLFGMDSSIQFPAAHAKFALNPRYCHNEYQCHPPSQKVNRSQTQHLSRLCLEKHIRIVLRYRKGWNEHKQVAEQSNDRTPNLFRRGT